jgi:uncharacterized protein (TIRG00374 family)
MSSFLNGNGKAIKAGLKKLVLPIILSLAIIIVFLKFSELKEIGRLFMQAKWYWLVVVLALQIFTSVLQTMVYQSIFKTLDIKSFGFYRMLIATTSMTFLNYTIPSLGFAGNISFIKNLRQRGVSDGTALMTVVMEFVCFYAGFAILVALCMAYLFFKLGSIGLTQKIAVGAFILIMLLIAGVVYFFLGNKKRARKRVHWLAEKIDMAENGIREEKRIEELLKDFYENFDWLKKNKKALISPTMFQIIRFVFEGVSIFFIFLAFGQMTAIGLGVTAFVLGRLFSLISFLPGGIGAFEGSMVLVFNSMGIRLELALAVMLIYRFFSYWLYFPVGLVCYKYLNGKNHE